MTDAGHNADVRSGVWQLPLRNRMFDMDDWVQMEVWKGISFALLHERLLVNRTLIVVLGREWR